MLKRQQAVCASSDLELYPVPEMMMIAEDSTVAVHTVNLFV